MQFIGSILGFVAGLVVLIKLFQKSGFLMGVIGLVTCNIYTFIWGWMNIKDEQLKLKNWMYIWTAVIILGYIAQFALASGE